ncbi:MAG TPA: erythromycin esterase family protein [Thermoanaerobaculia bacterium]|jgi:erythromycin esterase-like protein
MAILEAAGIRSLLTAAAHPLYGGSSELDPLLDTIGGARFVLLGGASHGTHEFYRVRAEITKRLVCEEGFRGVAVEADWPDAARVNRWVRALPGDEEAVDALGGFRRFPGWMWRNADVLDFVGWLRGRNDAIAEDRDKAGFYGLDLYSLHASMEAVVAYLERVDPDAARRAASRYACFDRFGGDAQGYGASTMFGQAVACEDEVIQQLIDLHIEGGRYLAREGRAAEDAFFSAEQNARLAKNAERYYRAMFGSQVLSWNLRERHMSETLDALDDHLSRDGEPAKIVVWAHNSHLGDARATEMGDHGEQSLGQLVRARRGADAVLVGFTTDSGTVTAASAWDGPAQRMRLTPAVEDAWEALFREVPYPRFHLDLHRDRALGEALSERRLERAIGVIYRPETERRSHYFLARLPEQFDAILHFDHTRAVEPLERTSLWMKGEPPVTYPTGI